MTQNDIKKERQILTLLQCLLNGRHLINKKCKIRWHLYDISFLPFNIDISFKYSEHMWNYIWLHVERYPCSTLYQKTLNIWKPCYQDESINWPNLLKVLDMEPYHIYKVWVKIISPHFPLGFKWGVHEEGEIKSRYF